MVENCCVDEGRRLDSDLRALVPGLRASLLAMANTGQEFVGNMLHRPMTARSMCHSQWKRRAVVLSIDVRTFCESKRASG